MLMFGWDIEVDARSRFWRWNFIKICLWTCDMNSTLGSVVPLTMFLHTKPPLFESHCDLICCSGSTFYLLFVYFYLFLPNFCTFFYFYEYHHLLLSSDLKNHLQWITLWLGLLQWFWRIPLPAPLSSKSQNYLSP